MKIFLIGGTTVAKSAAGYPTEFDLMLQAANELGRSIVKAGHDLVVCSPFEGTVDVEGIRGAAFALAGMAEITAAGNSFIEIHYPDSAPIREAVALLADSLALKKVRRFPCAPPLGETSQDGLRYAWVLAQLSALEHSSAVVALGGKLDGSANLLLLLAEAQRRNVIPLTFLGGAAEQAFQRRHYELADRLGDRLAILHDPSRVAEVIPLAEESAAERPARSKLAPPPIFFISYARARPQEADFLEMALRRRNLMVFRDEHDLGAGHSIPAEIREHIFRANVFVIVWCREYACSPWCHDELELALERRKSGSLDLWILCADDTRIVPPQLRNLLNYSVDTREKLEGKISVLLERLASRIPDSPP